MKKTAATIRVLQQKRLPGLKQETFRELARKVIEATGLHVSHLNIVFVDDEYLKSLHRQFLNDDTYTDVMTFNLSETGAIDGEIYISADRAKENAQKYQVSFADEIARLVIHGLLHLKGHDDRTDAGRRQMHQLENKYLKECWNSGEPA